MRKVTFESGAFDDFNAWAAQDRRMYFKIVDLLRDIQRSPFTGLSKPEPLRHELRGYWSRRIDGEHRLVYTITDDAIMVIACKYTTIADHTFTSVSSVVKFTVFQETYARI